MGNKKASGKLGHNRLGVGKKTSALLLAAALAVGTPAGMTGEASKAYADVEASVTAIGGIGSVTISGTPGTTLNLYRMPNVYVTSYTLGSGGDSTESSHVFAGLDPDVYYATQTSGGYLYGASNTVAAKPSAVTVAVGVEQIVVSGATSGATIKLYAPDGTEAQHAELDDGDTGYTFSDVLPAWNYYATQTVNGIESPESNYAPARPSAVTAVAGNGYVDVSGAFASAELTLHNANGTVAATHTLEAGEHDYRFAGVAGIFYVVQTVNGVVGMDSPLVTAMPPLLAINGGKRTVTVTNPLAGATLQLYTFNGTPVGAPYTLVAGETSHVFNNVPPGMNYFAGQTVNGIVNEGSNLVTVAPVEVTATGGVKQVAVTGAEPGAELKLHRADGTAAASYPLGAGETAYTFANVAPGTNYYVTQTVGGVESEGSAPVTAAAGEVTATGGVKQVAVTGAEPGAELKLHRADGTAADSYPLGAGETAYTFANVAPGTNYFVTQTVGGVDSIASGLVTVSPPAAEANGAVGSVAVTGAEPGAELKLYDAGNHVLDTRILSGAETGYTFEGVLPGLGYYVTQTAGGVESLNTNTVTSSPEKVTVEGAAGQAAVSAATAGATLRLYAADGTEAATAHTLGAGETSYTFTGVTPGTNYYVIQTVNGADSVGSVPFTVSPAAVIADGGAGSVAVSGATPGAVLKLYAADGSSALDPYSLTGSDTAHTFTGLAPGMNYYAVQTVGGVDSMASNLVSVEPEAPEIRGITRKIEVKGATAGAILTLYRKDLSVADSYTLTGEETSHVFTQRIVTGAEYFASQTVNGVESEWAGPARAHAPADVVEETQDTQEAEGNSFDVLVNGKAESMGAAKKSMRGEQPALTVTMDEKKLLDKLASEGPNAVITIPFGPGYDIEAGELNGQMLKELAGKQAVIVIRTPDGSYSLPAQLLDIEDIEKRLDSAALEAITIRIEMAKPDAMAAALAARRASALQGVTLAAPPLVFAVTAEAGGNTIVVNRLGGYAERAFAIPAGVDLSQITTGVAIDEDGTVRHAPTRIEQIDGKAYALVSNVSNGVYALVSHPVAFRDAAGHWAKQAINDMGARMVIEGNGTGLFQPDRSITRGEFAAILVRALGLKTDGETSKFSDVKASDGFDAVIRTAVSYGLIDGFEDGTFRPADPITREQAMAIIAKAMKWTGLSAGLSEDGAGRSLSSFKDEGDAAGWAREAIADCLEAGVIQGKTSTRLAPKAAITRAETAAIVQRLLQRSALI
ncbi:S-layer homology domain-containing protein [Paenibacillus rhizovicinus]|uniref:S-layer homology domain-containing protein n=1 Tax=Paenibacillus rhizovicinus TaxID=2704463 RepID=A0A6C0NUU8_9BACL|nr:S-layer homology domain-containing protein [Paenibacillus rhizovicinus]QHW29928.1 S-layer homology domain-containing protein [Paenibacillus rhizovicinus]